MKLPQRTVAIRKREVVLWWRIPLSKPTHSWKKKKKENGTYPFWYDWAEAGKKFGGGFDLFVGARGCLGKRKKSVVRRSLATSDIPWYAARRYPQMFWQVVLDLLPSSLIFCS